MHWFITSQAGSVLPHLVPLAKEFAHKMGSVKNVAETMGRFINHQDIICGVLLGCLHAEYDDLVAGMP